MEPVTFATADGERILIEVSAAGMNLQEQTQLRRGGEWTPKRAIFVPTGHRDAFVEAVQLWTP